VKKKRTDKSPLSGVIKATDRSFYGTTKEGSCRFASDAPGTIFKVTLSSEYSVLYRFHVQGDDGYAPVAQLISSRDGKIYGTTEYGGKYPESGDSPGNGTVFCFTPAGSFKTLHTFRRRVPGKFTAPRRDTCDAKAACDIMITGALCWDSVFWRERGH
jgi:uncharacterized repeat protein (TIGR03803 family)